MKYQDLKIRDVGRMALLGAALAVLVGLGLVARRSIEPILGPRLIAMIWGIGSVVPLVVAMCVWYLLSTPAQNASFIRWAQRTLRQGPPPDFDWSLLDPADPAYHVPTIRYLLSRKFGAVSKGR